jgi:hypothetical protein
MKCKILVLEDEDIPKLMQSVLKSKKHKSHLGLSVYELFPEFYNIIDESYKKIDFEAFTCEIKTKDVTNFRLCFKKNGKYNMMFPQMIREYTGNRKTELYYTSIKRLDEIYECVPKLINNQDYGNSEFNKVFFIYYVEKNGDQLKFYPGFVNSKKVGKVFIDEKAYDYNSSWMKPILVLCLDKSLNARSFNEIK